MLSLRDKEAMFPIESSPDLADLVPRTGLTSCTMDSPYTPPNAPSSFPPMVVKPGRGVRITVFVIGLGAIVTGGFLAGMIAKLETTLAELGRNSGTSMPSFGWLMNHPSSIFWILGSVGAWAIVSSFRSSRGWMWCAALAAAVLTLAAVAIIPAMLLREVAGALPATPP